MKHEIISASEAKAKGLKFYFTGVPCRRGGIGLRRVTGQCLCELCAAVATEGSKRRYQKNRDQVLERTKRYQREHADMGRKAALAHYHRNRDRLLPQKRERARKFREEQPGVVRGYIHQRRKGRKLATPPWANIEAINAIYKEAKRMQAQDGIKRHVDHKIPLIHPLVCGLHVESNLQILTAAQNMAKKNDFAPITIVNGRIA